MKRIQAAFTGNVQGVGFRFTAERIARKLGLTGYVKNMPNGGVEVVCEGDKPRIDAFLDEIRDSMYGYISDSHVQWKNAIGIYNSFKIEF